jgi:hypothetical protein
MTANERPDAASAMTTWAPGVGGEHTVGDRAQHQVGADEIGDVARSRVGGHLTERSDLKRCARRRGSPRDPRARTRRRIMGDHHTHAVERLEVAP